MEKDEIGFDLALISKFVPQKKNFFWGIRLLIAFINKPVY
jgi:hypothetical protein